MRVWVCTLVQACTNTNMYMCVGVSTTTMQDTLTHSPVRVALPRCTRCTLLYTEESYSSCRQEEGEGKRQAQTTCTCMCVRAVSFSTPPGSTWERRRNKARNESGTRRRKGNKRRRFSAPLVPARAHSHEPTGARPPMITSPRLHPLQQRRPRRKGRRSHNQAK